MERIPPLLEQGDAWLEVRPAGSSDHEPPSFRQAVQGSAFMSIDKPWNVALHMGSNRNVGDKTPTKQETGASTPSLSNDLTQTPSEMSTPSIHDISVGSLDTGTMPSVLNETVANESDSDDDLEPPTFAVTFGSHNDRYELVLVIGVEVHGSALLVAHSVHHAPSRDLALDTSSHGSELALNSPTDMVAPGRGNLVFSSYFLDEDFSSVRSESDPSAGSSWLRTSRSGVRLLRYPWLDSTPHPTGMVYGHGRVLKVASVFTSENPQHFPNGVSKRLVIAELQLEKGRWRDMPATEALTPGASSSVLSMTEKSWSTSISSGLSTSSLVSHTLDQQSFTADNLDIHSLQNGYVVVEVDDSRYCEILTKKWTKRKVTTALQALARSQLARSAFQRRADYVHGIPRQSQLAVRSVSVVSHRFSREMSRDGSMKPVYRVMVRSRRGVWWALERSFEQCWILERHARHGLRSSEYGLIRAPFPSRYGEDNCFMECMDPYDGNADRRQEGLHLWLRSLVTAAHTCPALANWLNEFFEAPDSLLPPLLPEEYSVFLEEGRRSRISVFEDPPGRSQLRPVALPLPWCFVCGL